MSSLQQSIKIGRAYKLFESGDSFNAGMLAERIVKREPKNLAALRLLGLIALGANDPMRASSYLNKCIALCPRDARLRWDLARVHLVEGRYDAAIACYDKSLKLKPDFIEAVTGKADVLERRGDPEAARALIEPYIQAGTEEIGMAVVYLKLEQRAGRYREGLALADRHLADATADPLAQRHLFAMNARAYEKVEDYDKAFEAYTNANRWMAQPFDPVGYRDKVDELVETFSAQNMPLLSRSRNRSELPIFIACMPRSGSTLVEQIIHAHPRAHGAGEIPHLNRMILELQGTIGSIQTYPACIADLTERNLDELSKSYLDELKRMGRSAVRVTNKHLDNYAHLAMVSLLFPGARVIHIHRDPLDNCFSCFMAALKAPWASNLRNMAFAYRQYQRVMQHWREVLDLPILDVAYEDLVDDPDRWIREIIEFCGLEWDERCLRYYEADRNVLTISYDQVRQPIYKAAVKRYEKYEAFLGPLREALASDDWIGDPH